MNEEDYSKEFSDEVRNLVTKVWLNRISQPEAEEHQRAWNAARNGCAGYFVSEEAEKEVL